MYRNKLHWSDNFQPTDIIIFNEYDHPVELNKDLRIENTLHAYTTSSIKNMIKKHWDFFVTVGTKEQFWVMNLVLTQVTPNLYDMDSLLTDHMNQRSY